RHQGRAVRRVPRDPGDPGLRPPRRRVSSEVSRSTRRAATRVLAGLLLGVILYGAAELCAFGAFWVIFGEAFSFARMAAERESRAYDTAFGDPVRPAAQEPEVIHPYLGYVKNPEVRAPKGRQPNAFGFLGAEPPIFKRREGRVIVAFLGGSFAQSLALRGRSESARARRLQATAAVDDRGISTQPRRAIRHHHQCRRLQRGRASRSGKREPWRLPCLSAKLVCAGLGAARPTTSRPRG